MVISFMIAIAAAKAARYLVAFIKDKRSNRK
jgi:hypothetical protein